MDSVALALHVIGSVAALIAAWFWFSSARIEPGDLDFLGRWSDDGAEQANWIANTARKNAKGAIWSALAALAFGIGGLMQLLGD